ncbi:MAG TPA: 2-C-methyl-D-erythritol 4-phosphate cytidylyltransferase [Dissulfurispiraceae bacterium]|nr:2-C-methyl-D-erythritol 4-phosphate cytidylyltransferase [Dissulfurispiraceae bacterium]
MPAAGLGKRFGAEKNKPFFLLAGKPIIIWSLDLLQSVDEIDEVIPVVREDDITTTAELIEEYGIRKVKRIMAGGKKRQDSVYNGLQAITDAKSIVVIHDCGRPLAETETIRAAIREVKGSDGTVAGVPVKDTIKEAAPSTDACNSDKVMVCRTLRRDVLFAAQTPQVFPFDVIMEAHTRARSEQFYGTDDASLVERYGGKVKIVMGSYTNIKITTPGDIFIAEALLKMRKQGAG